MADLSPTLRQTLLWTTLALTPGCDRPRCPDLEDTPCDIDGQFYCDPCGTVWFCSQFSIELDLEWAQAEWPCACVLPGGELNDDKRECLETDG